MNYFFKILIFWSSFRAFLERKVFIKNIGKNDLVLDVGSGDKPFWRADIIVDKHLKDNQQRHSGSMLFDKRKIFIQADVEKLPFKDKIFDFVFCSHLLEHVENPDIAISELIRVAKSGYIEVPNSILEMLRPFPPHLWYCLYVNNVLLFKQKEKQDVLMNSIEMFGESIFNNNIFQYLLNKDINRIFIRLYWKRDVSFRILRIKNKENVYQYKEKLSNNKSLSLKISFIVYVMLYNILTLLFYKRKNFEIKNILK